MIIDPHCHIWPEQVPGASLGKMMENTAEFAGFKSKQDLFSASADKVIEEMEEAGIDKPRSCCQKSQVGGCGACA